MEWNCCSEGNKDGIQSILRWQWWFVSSQIPSPRPRPSETKLRHCGLNHVQYWMLSSSRICSCQTFQENVSKRHALTPRRCSVEQELRPIYSRTLCNYQTMTHHFISNYQCYSRCVLGIGIAKFRSLHSSQVDSRNHVDYTKVIKSWWEEGRGFWCVCHQSHPIVGLVASCYR